MKNFSKYFDFIADDETKLSVKKIADKAQIVSKKNMCIVTDFVSSNVINYSLPIIKNSDINYKLFPSYEYSERKSLILYPDFICENDIDINSYFTALRIYNKSKFKELDHKNYLGSIMSLGIERDKIGDIYVHEDFADIICMSDIGDVILYSLEKAGNNRLEIQSIDFETIQFKEPEHINMVISTTSMRLDNIVKSIINKSRDLCNDLISSGDVKVNYIVADKSSQVLKQGDLLSIRRYGRYIIEKEVGSTKSGKVKLDIKHFV